MSKKYSIFITVLFCAFLFGFGIAHFILPDRDFSAMGPYLAAMFGFGAGALDGDFLYYLRNYLAILIIAIVAATPLAKTVWHKLPERARQIAFPVLMLAGLTLTAAYLVDGTYNPFLYFRF